MTDETNPIMNLSPENSPEPQSLFARLRRWAAPPVFPGDAEKTRRASMVNSILLAALFLGILFTLSIPWGSGSVLDPLGIIAMVITVAIVGLTSLRRGNVGAATYMLITFGWVLTAGVSTTYGGVGGPIFPNFVIVILISGVLLGYQTAVLFTIASILFGGLLLYLESLGIFQPALITQTTYLIRNAFIFIAVYFISYLTNNNFLAALRKAESSHIELEKDNQGLAIISYQAETEKEEIIHRLERRDHFLSLGAQIAQVTVSTDELQDLLDQCTQLIANSFNYYHVGLFLIEEDPHWAILRSASSDGGRAMIARNHRLGVGKQGIVGYVTGIGQSRVTQDIQLDRIHSVTPELPETRSEMALPLKVRGGIIGALDIQDQIPNAFPKEDISALQTLADQISLAIENMRLFKQAEEIKGQDQAVYGDISQKTWGETRRQKSLTAYKFSGGQLTPLSDPNVTLSSENKLEIPIIVRGSKIGTIEIAKEDLLSEWTEDEEGVLNTLSDQLGVALDSARLFNETQLRASTERIIGDINADIWESLEINSILRTTVEKLQQSLELPEVSIKMTAPRGPQELSSSVNPQNTGESN